MQSESPDFLSYFGEPQATSKQPQLVRESDGPYEITYSFINHTLRPITVVTRLGLPFTVPCTLSGLSSSFIIRVQYFFKHSVKDNVKTLLSRVGTASPAELRVLKESFDATAQTGYRGGESATIDYEVSERTIVEMGGSMYHQPVDCVLSFDGVYDAPCHPASSLGRETRAKQSSSHVHDEIGFGYQVDIIDNTARSGAYFININNTVWNIRPRKDTGKQDGIYILTNKESIGDVVIAGKTYIQLPLDPEAALAHGLYPTYAEAEALGDVVSQRKKELLEMEHELKVSQQENAMMKLAHERELRETERRYKELELERDAKAKQLAAEQDMTTHLMNLDKLRYKDQMDYKATQRKDYSEVLKALPVAIVAVGAIYSVVKGMVKK